MSYMMSYETKIVLAVCLAAISGLLMGIAMVSMMAGSPDECRFRVSYPGQECVIGWVPIEEKADE